MSAPDPEPRPPEDSSPEEDLSLVMPTSDDRARPMEVDRRHLKHQLEFQKMVYDFSSKMRSQRDVDSIARVLVEAVSELTSFRNTILSVFEEDGRTLRGVVGSGHKRTFEIGQRLAKYQLSRLRVDVSAIPQYVHAMETGEVYYHRTKEDIVQTLSAMTGLNPGILEIIRRTTRMNLALTVPLYIGEPGKGMVPLGFIGISSLKSNVEDSEVKVVRILADQASLALYNALLFERVKQQASQARESEGRFRRIMDTAHDMIMSYGSSGEVLFANNALRESKIYSISGELVDSETLDMVHPDDQAKLVEAYLGLQEDIPIRGIEFRIRSHSGEWLNHNMNAAVVVDQAGKVDEKVVFIRDVTVERWREAQMVRRNQELEVLNSLITNLASSTDYDDMISRSLAIIAEFTGADIISLVSIESPEERILHLEGHLWVPDEYLAFLKKNFPKIPATGLFSGTEVQVMLDLELVPPEFKYYMDKYGIRSIVSVPVLRMGEATGYVICGLKTPFNVDDEGIAILRAVGDQLGLVLETARIMKAQ